MLLAVLCAWPIFDAYFFFESNIFLILALAPFIIYVPKAGVRSIRYGLLAMVFLLLYPVMKMQTFFFVGISFTLLFFIEAFIGKTNNSALILIALSSPLINYFVKIMGFPIRLQLTEFATTILKLTGMDISSDGNEILLNGSLFFVEPACMGLKLVITALVITLAITSFYERRIKTRFHMIEVVGWLLIAFVLVIGANLARIIGLIMFNSPPDTLSHELIGLMCLAFYVIIPLVFMVSFVLKRKTPTEPLEPAHKVSNSNSNTILSVLLVLGIGAVSLFKEDIKTVDQLAIAIPFELDGFESSAVDFGGMKYLNDRALVYYKPAKNFWSPDHNPLICWRGSGYEFKHEKTWKINGHEVFVAQLVKDKDLLYTAWWFDNAEKVSISEWDWRTDMALGAAPYAMFNVSCAAKEEMESQVMWFLEKDGIK